MNKIIIKQKKESFNGVLSMALINSFFCWLFLIAYHKFPKSLTSTSGDATDLFGATLAIFFLFTAGLWMVYFVVTHSKTNTNDYEVDAKLIHPEPIKETIRK